MVRTMRNRGILTSGEPGRLVGLRPSAIGEGMTMNRQSILLPPTRRRVSVSLLSAVGAFPAAVLLARLPAMAQLGGLPFVAVVVLCTALGRLAVGAASAVAATILLDLYVIPPTGRLNLERASDYVAVGIFALASLATAIVVSYVERINAERKRSTARLAFVASSLQRRLLPVKIPEVPPFDVEIGYWPAGEGTEVGGDFYDVFEPREGQLVVVIGDVSGKGPEAAAYVGAVRHIIRTLAVTHDHPADVLERLNDPMLEEMSDDRFCTVCIGMFDAALTDSAQVRIACAGHPQPYLIKRGGEVRAATARGTLLGVMHHVSFDEYSTKLQPGDTVVMYTDGLYERPRGSTDKERDVASLLLGIERLPPRDAVRRVAQEMDVFSGALLDDTALVVVRNAYEDPIAEIARHGDAG
jgi:serine phosphatase RsbU (regulator of sigma subunit)